MWKELKIFTLCNQFFSLTNDCDSREMQFAVSNVHFHYLKICSDITLLVTNFIALTWWNLFISHHFRPPIATEWIRVFLKHWCNFPFFHNISWSFFLRSFTYYLVTFRISQLIVFYNYCVVLCWWLKSVPFPVSQHVAPLSQFCIVPKHQQHNNLLRNFLTKTWHVLVLNFRTE